MVPDAMRQDQRGDHWYRGHHSCRGLREAFEDRFRSKGEMGDVDGLGRLGTSGGVGARSYADGAAER